MPDTTPHVQMHQRPAPRVVPRPGGTPRAEAASRLYALPPIVDRERGDAWAVSRRRGWAATVLEDVIRRGYRVLADMEPGHPASCIVFSPRAQMIYWRERGVQPTSSVAPHLIADPLAVYIVTHFDLTRLWIEEEDGWHKLPLAPGKGRKDRRRV